MKYHSITLDELYLIFQYIGKESGYTPTQIDNFIVDKAVDLKIQLETEDYFSDLTNMFYAEHTSDNTAH